MVHHFHQSVSQLAKWNLQPAGQPHHVLWCCSILHDNPAAATGACSAPVDNISKWGDYYVNYMEEAWWSIGINHHFYIDFNLTISNYQPIHHHHFHTTILLTNFHQQKRLRSMYWRYDPNGLEIVVNAMSSNLVMQQNMQQNIDQSKILCICFEYYQPREPWWMEWSMQVHHWYGDIPGCNDGRHVTFQCVLNLTQEWQLWALG